MKNLWKKYGWVLFLIPLLFGFLLVGRDQSDLPAYDQSVMAPPMEASLDEEVRMKEVSAPAGTTAMAAATERKIIREYDLSLQVRSSIKTEKQIKNMLSGTKGYIQESQLINEERGSRQVTLVLRVPGGGADAFLNRLSALGKVLDRRMTTQDVTKQYQDLESRLRNWQRQEEQLLGIMKRSETVAEVLAVAKELGEVRERIESLTGEIRFLSQQTDFSLIRLTLTEHGPIDGSSVPGLEFLNRLWSSFWESFKALFVVIVGILPWAVFAALIWWLWRRLVNRRPVEKKEAKKAE